MFEDLKKKEKNTAIFFRKHRNKYFKQHCMKCCFQNVTKISNCIQKFVPLKHQKIKIKKSLSTNIAGIPRILVADLSLIL